MTYTEDTFNEHLSQDHKMSIISEYLKEIIYGGTDGIVTTFAVVAGFSGAYLTSENTITLSVMTVLLFGLANLFGDGAAMGLGNYIALRADHHKYNAHKQQERTEIQENPEQEKHETLFLLKQKGLSQEDAETMTDIFSKYPDYWLDFMMHEELGLQSTEDINPIVNGAMTFGSFCIFGFIPIIPYLFISDARTAFYMSCICALVALILLGGISGWASRRHYLSTILETLIVGSVAATIAYFVGTLFA